MLQQPDTIASQNYSTHEFLANTHKRLLASPSGYGIRSSQHPSLRINSNKRFAILHALSFFPARRPVYLRISQSFELSAAWVHIPQAFLSFRTGSSALVSRTLFKHHSVGSLGVLSSVSRSRFCGDQDAEAQAVGFPAGLASSARHSRMVVRMWFQVMPGLPNGSSLGSSRELMRSTYFWGMYVALSLGTCTSTDLVIL